MKFQIVFLLLLILLLTNISSAQDTLREKIDSVPKEKNHSPTFAGVASAIIPGAGQVYNRKYWKVPIVYAGLLTAGYFAYRNGNVYFTVRNNLDSRVFLSTHRPSRAYPINHPPSPQPQFLLLNPIFSNTTYDLNEFTYNDLIQLEDDYRKYFTISIIVGGVVYMLNILDAVVDAHLYHFDVSDNLSLDWQPQIFSSFTGRVTPGLSLSLSIK